jgi:hypothetical protein
MRKCANCKFKTVSLGVPQHCRAVPPSAHNALSASFPVVKDEWGCGLHRYSLRRLLKSLVARRAVQDKAS